MTHDLSRDLLRLHLLDDVGGLEAFSLPGKISDFFRYYFTRFVSNLTHAFAPFSVSEIERWNQTHRLSAVSFHYQFDKKHDRLVPIPKGMVHSYFKTLTELTNILDDVSYTQVRKHLLLFSQCLLNGKLVDLPGAEYDLARFNVSKKHLASLYTEMGLTHRPAKDVLVTTAQISTTNTKLRQLTQQIYPDIIAINKILKELEQHHRKQSWSHEQQVLIKTRCMSLGYRLTMLALVVDHFQKLEHQFVHSLDLLVTP